MDVVQRIAAEQKSEAQSPSGDVDGAMIQRIQPPFVHVDLSRRVSFGPPLAVSLSCCIRVRAPVYCCRHAVSMYDGLSER